MECITGGGYLSSRKGLVWIWWFDVEKYITPKIILEDYTKHFLDEKQKIANGEPGQQSYE